MKTIIEHINESMIVEMKVKAKNVVAISKKDFETIIKNFTEIENEHGDFTVLYDFDFNKSNAKKLIDLLHANIQVDHVFDEVDNVISVLEFMVYENVKKLKWKEPKKKTALDIDGGKNTIIQTDTGFQLFAKIDGLFKSLKSDIDKANQTPEKRYDEDKIGYEIFDIISNMLGVCEKAIFDQRKEYQQWLLKNR